MLYYLFEYLDKTLNIPGAGVFQYITFRAFAAIITSLGIAAIWGKSVIYRLQRLQIGEEIRDLGLEGQMAKKGTPTMGGFIILLSLLIPTLLFSKITNVYIVLLVTSAIWLGAVGFVDDYIKVFKKNKQGLAGKFKVIGQIGVGIIVGSILYFHPDVQVHQEVSADYELLPNERIVSNMHVQDGDDAETTKWIETDAMTTTVPFIKQNEFNVFHKTNILPKCVI